MLVHAIVVYDRDIPCFPVVAHAVVDLVAGAVEDIEGGLVDMAVILGRPARRIFPEMDVQRLGAAVLGLDIVAAEMLRAAVELDVLALDHARHCAQPAELVLEAVFAFERAGEDGVAGGIGLLVTHRGLPWRTAYRRAGFVTISLYSLSHLAFSSSSLAGSTNFSVMPSGSGLTFRLVGMKSRLPRISCPSDSRKSMNSTAA